MKVIFQHYGVAQPHNYSNEFLSRLVLCLGALHLWYNMCFHNSVWSSKTVAAACFASSEDAPLFPAANQSPGRFLAYHPAFAQIKYVKRKTIYYSHLFCSVTAESSKVMSFQMRSEMQRWPNIRSVSRVSGREGLGDMTLSCLPAGRTDWLTRSSNISAPNVRILLLVAVTHPDRTEAAFLPHIPAWACDCDGWMDWWKFMTYFTPKIN